MPGVTELDELLASMSPKLVEGEFVFCTVDGVLSDYIHVESLATFREKEGLTLVLDKQIAIKSGMPFESTYSLISLTVHSSLEAVGLTAAVSTKLAAKGISANVMAAYYHDHIFVQTEKAQMALLALKEFSQKS
jgi:hypothetical protein